MTKEEFDREVQDLVDMLKNLRKIKDRGRRAWLKKEIRRHLNGLMND